MSRLFPCLCVLSFAALGAAEWFQPTYPTQSAFSDVSNLTQSMTRFQFAYNHDEADPDSFINGLRFAPGAGWHADINLDLFTWGLSSWDGNYTFGERISGARSTQYTLSARGGAIAPTVPVGLYGFQIEVLGGATDTATDVLATLDYSLDVRHRLQGLAWGATSPAAVGPGQTSAISMSVLNTGSDALVTYGRYQGWVPSGATDAIFSRMNVEFDSSSGFMWSQEIAAGATATGSHSKATARANSPMGSWALYGGWVGGYYPNEWHYLPMVPAPRVEVVPEPASLMALGIGALVLIRARKRR